MNRALVMMGLAATLCGTSLTVQADEVDVAQIKCSEFLEEKDSIGMFLMWLDGYASQKSNNTVLSDEWIEKLGKHMATFCSQNPDTPILEAAAAME